MAKLMRCLLDGETLDSKRAAQELRLNEPAARLYLDALEEVPGVGRVEGRARRLRFEPRFDDKERPSKDDVVAACFGASLATVFGKTAYGTHLREVRDRLLKQAGLDDEFANADRKFLFVPGGGEVAFEDHRENLNQLIEALRTDRLIGFDYEDFKGSRSAVKTEPLTLAIYEHQFYVIGNSKTGVRAYRFSRMDSVECLTTKFRYPKASAYSPEKLLRTASASS